MVNTPSGLLTCLPRCSARRTVLPVFKSKFLFFLVIWTLLAASSAFVAVRAADSPPPTLAVVGDSLSAAYGMFADEGWVALLEARLDDIGHPHRVINASISGETTSGGLARLPRLLERHAPAILIIQLGGNDGLRGIDIPTLEGNLARMIELGQSAGSAVILTGIRIPRNYNDTYYEAFEAVYPTLAERYDVPMVEFLLEGVALDPALMQADGIHPTAAAQPRLLENMWPALEQALALSGARADELAASGPGGQTP
ncbi:MAG: arylesterase [Gammaproteobacteria bacterium]|nr:MAG: arylesterase [Gammaproteobacteria bacterium]